VSDPERKRFPPTPIKLRQAADSGSHPRSPWIAPGASLVALLVVTALARSAFGAFGGMLEGALAGAPASVTPGALTPFLEPMVIGPAVVLVALVVGQGISFRSPIPPNPLSFMNGLRRLFSKQNFQSGLLALVGLFLFSATVYLAWTKVAGNTTLGPPMAADNTGVSLGLVNLVVGGVSGVGLLMVIGFAVIARVQYNRSLMETPEELKQDMRAMEGDPTVRRRWSELRRQMSRARMRPAIARSDVVVVNPTHYAVALAYEPWRKDAPEVVAKGRGAMARRIRRLAQELDVPVVPVPELARDLYRTVRVGDAIPGRLYRAVADVLAYLSRHYGYRPRTSAEGG